MDYTPVPCDSCAHLVRDEDGEGNTCFAYPREIPAEIVLFGADDHTSLRGDEERPVTWKLRLGGKDDHDAYLHFRGEATTSTT